MVKKDFEDVILRKNTEKDCDTIYVKIKTGIPACTLVYS